MLRMTLVLVALLALAAPASATAPPVGKLPKGPVSTISTTRGELFALALALPHRSGGLVWRAAVYPGVKVARPLSEADVADAVVLTYRAVGRGTVTLKFGLTRGETLKAYASRTFVIRVR
jgi:hypothetical protein